MAANDFIIQQVNAANTGTTEAVKTAAEVVALIGAAPSGSGVTNGDSHDHNGGDGAAIVEAAITLADNTTNNVSATKHGFFPKLPSVSDGKTYAIKDGAVAEIPAASGLAAGTESGTKSTATHGATASNTGAIAIGDEATTGGAVASAAGAIAIGTKGTVAATASGADAVAIGTGANSSNGISIGKNSGSAAIRGVAIGDNSSVGSSATNSVAVGAYANVISNVSTGLAIGYNNTVSANYATALGNNANSQYAYSIAIGSYSTTKRYGETSISGDHASTNKNPWGMVQWIGTTTDGNATELFLHGVSSNRCTVTASSAIHFILRLIAREDATGDCKVVEVKGGIKRDASNNTALIGSVTSTTICEDSGASAWTVAVTADDTNESLKVAVTGETSHTIKWHAVAELIEVVN